MGVVAFRQLKEGTLEDFARLRTLEVPYRGPTKALVALLESLRGSSDEGWPVNVYKHTLQTGTLALRDGADEETVVCAALHDVGHEIAHNDHGTFIADLLAPYISAENEWILRYHPAFQMQFLPGYFDDPRVHESYRGHPLFDRALAFVERWDQAAFDPDYDTMPLEVFEPMMRRVLTVPRADWSQRTAAQRQGT